MQDKTGLLANLNAEGPEGRPWDSGELDGGYALSEVDQLDPAAVLAGQLRRPPRSLPEAQAVAAQIW